MFCKLNPETYIVGAVSEIPLGAAVEVVGVGVLVGVGVTVTVGVTDTALVVGVIVGVTPIVEAGVLVGVILIVGVGVLVGVIEIVGVGEGDGTAVIDILGVQPAVGM